MHYSGHSPELNALLATNIDGLQQARVLCVGDLVLDSFVYGHVERISPEAPIPVLAIAQEETMLGGAGNVVRNIRALGAESGFIAVVGDDKIGMELMRMVGSEPRVQPYILTERGRLSSHKTRYIAGNQQLLRADKETKEPVKHSTIDHILTLLEEETPHYDVVVLSDYGKGTLTDEVIKKAIDVAAIHKKPVIIDPKSRDFSRYKGAFLITPNINELSAATASEIKTDAQIVTAARQLMQAHEIANLLVTRSKDGMTLVTESDVVHIPAQAREIYDVSGAGDTVVATVSTALAAGYPLPQAATLANIAAGIAVGKLGTAVVYQTDLKTALYTQERVDNQRKILPKEVAADQVSIWKREGKRIGFTNGCFDLLHAGHLSLLSESRHACDKLIVGVNSDASVKRLKGASRPVNGEIERAMLLAALSVVDMVVIFAEDTPMELIETFRPDSLIKGADYSKEQVVGGAFVEAYGGKILLASIKEGYSTTGLIERMA